MESQFAREVLLAETTSQTRGPKHIEEHSLSITVG